MRFSDPVAGASLNEESDTTQSMSFFNRMKGDGSSVDPIARSPAISIPSTSSLLQSARTSGAFPNFEDKPLRKQPVSRSLEESSLFHSDFGVSLTPSADKSADVSSFVERKQVGDSSNAGSILQPYNAPLKIPRSPAIPISSGKLRASAPEFKAPLQFGGLSAPSHYNISSGSDASYSPPATSSSSSPPDSRLQSLFYTLSSDMKTALASSDPTVAEVQQLLPMASMLPSSLSLGKMSCFLLCDVSRDVSLESMRRCVQEKFDLPMSEKSLSEAKGSNDTGSDEQDEDPKVRIEFGEGGPGAGRVAFVFVPEKHAHKLHNVKRFRAVVDGVKMRMKVTHVPMNLVEQYR